jgi:hypothetical protein
MADDSDTYPNIFGPLSPDIYDAFRKRLGLPVAAPSPAVATATPPEPIHQAADAIVQPWFDPQRQAAAIGHAADISRVPLSLAGQAIDPIMHGAQLTRQAYEAGVAGTPMTTEEMIPGAAETAKGFIGKGTPFAMRGAAGVAGGKLITPTQSPLYHVASDWNGQDLLPLAHRYRAGNESNAIDQFLTKWPDASPEMAAAHVHNVHLYDDLQQAAEHADALGGQVYKVDPALVEGLRRDKLELNHPVASRVPANAITPVGSPGSPQATALPPGLTVNDILHPDYPAVKPRSQNVEDIAQRLHDRGSAALTNLGVPGGKLTGPSDYDEHLSNAIASEIQAAQARTGHAGDWYTDKVREAQSVASLLHPEIATDPNARFAWNAGLAVTSQGEKVPSNVRLANQVMQYYRENGRFPTNIVAKNGPAMNNNFGKLNDLIDDMGVDGARQFMDRKFTVRDLEAMGHDIGGENKNTMVHGSTILGPKIGGGFYQNLNGNYDPTTMDLWFMRGWGRLTGTLVGRPPEKPIARFQQALRDQGANFIPETREDLLGRAGDVIGAHERDFAQNRALYDSGDRTKSELTYSAERAWKALKGINEQPTSGGQRQWIRSVWNRAREILGDQGHNITNADMQALWWYPEKDLYAKMGGVESKGINVDYSTALQDAARKAGHSEDAIQGALSAAHRGSGPAAAANVAGGKPVFRPQGGGIYAGQGLPQIGQGQ